MFLCFIGWLSKLTASTVSQLISAAETVLAGRVILAAGAGEGIGRTTCVRFRTVTTKALWALHYHQKRGKLNESVMSMEDRTFERVLGRVEIWCGGPKAPFPDAE
jgi:hypothetical protein